MKNLKGALPPIREERQSNRTYFHGLGMGLMLIGLILGMGTFFLFLLAAGSGGVPYNEGEVALPLGTYYFVLFMSLVLLVSGLFLMWISKRLDPGKRVRNE